MIQQEDILVDMFKFLELNEIEKSKYVSSFWYKVVRKSLGFCLKQRRRILKVKIYRKTIRSQVNKSLSLFSKTFLVHF